MRLKLTTANALKHFVAVLLLLCFQSTGSSSQGQTEWQRLNAKEDNFSVLLPVTPEIRSEGNFTLGMGGEQIYEERVAAAYHNGVVYLAKLYEAANPKGLLKKYPEVFHLSNYSESPVKVGEIEGKQFLIKGDAHFIFIRVFSTGGRLYVLEAAARDEMNPDAQRFLSSLTLGKKNAVSGKDASAPTQAQLNSNTPVLPISDTAQPFTAKDVTHRAAIIYGPQPPFTPTLGQSLATGIIKLRVVLLPNGKVTGVEVLKGFSGGVTKEAMEAAKAIKFLPAEKDGRLVAQYAEVTYGYEKY